jgi:hypothetical protein
MFERRKLVLALVGLPERIVDGGLQGTRERGHSRRPSGQTHRPEAGAGKDFSLTHYPLNFGFIHRASRAIMPPPGEKRKKNAAPIGADSALRKGVLRKRPCNDGDRRKLGHPANPHARPRLGPPGPK